MTKTLTVCFVICTLIFSSCEEKNSLDCCVPESIKLEGAWNLISVSCECQPSDLTYGEHVWTFDITDFTLTIENTVEKPLQILSTGQYDYEITDSGMHLEGVNYDYYFDEDYLYLADQPESDGPLMKFER